MNNTKTSYLSFFCTAKKEEKSEVTSVHWFMNLRWRGEQTVN